MINFMILTKNLHFQTFWNYEKTEIKELKPQVFVNYKKKIPLSTANQH